MGNLSSPSGDTTASWIGGLVGVNNGLISESYSGNRIVLSDTTSTAGGFVGLNTGSIDQSYYKGSGAG